MFLILISTLIVLYVIVSKRMENYWKDRGVYHVKRSRGLIKAIKNISFNRNQSFFEVGEEVYNEIKNKNFKYGGTYSFNGQTFIVNDPELIKNILVKDFDSFNNHGFYHNDKVDPITGHLFNLEGAKWKRMRQNLTPTFTSGKMKMMFQTMLECTQELKIMLDEYANKKEGVPIVDSLARFTTDIIANVAFGIDVSSIKNPNAEFREHGRNVFKPTKWGGLKILFIPNLPKAIVELFSLKMVKPEIENFFMDIVKKNAKYREQNNIVRRDFFQLLLQLKNQGKLSDDANFLNEDSDNSKLTIEEVAAQCFLFFVAGFDTSSNVMTFTLYELAVNQALQTKVRDSVNKVLAKYNGEITYEAINEMNYLHMVVSETMRKYPVLAILPRACSKDYKIPDSNLVIKKGINVWIPVSGLHRDPQYYPNPEQYNPERFTPENMESLKGKCVYLPFGEGPRQCIGLRFGLLQSKVGLSMILKHYRISLNTKCSGPLEIRPRTFITTPKDDVYLDFVKI